MILGDNTYYVSSSTTNDCPQQCHPLSYYITHTATYFTSNATFIFMKGEHLLDSKGLVQVDINDVNSLTLKGEKGHSNTDTIIRCGSNTHELVFYNGSIIIIYGITITGCGHQHSSLILAPVGAFLIVNYRHVIIANSTFINNTVKTYGGALVMYCDIGTQYNITITDSIFTSNTVNGAGGGLIIFINTAKSSITITNSAFSKNKVGGDGGGLVIIRVYSTLMIMII